MRIRCRQSADLRPAHRGPVALVLAVTATLLLGQPQLAGESREPPAANPPLGERQLFLDDVGIAEIHHLARTMHPPQKRGAVIRPDLPWEMSLQTRSAPAWDAEKGLYRLWLITSVGDRATGTPDPTFGGTTYVESPDGMTWTKPVLRQLEYKGSMENNFLSFPTSLMENAICDPDDPNPERRFKGLLGALGRRPAVSPDGIHWQALGLPEIPAGDESNLSYDRATHTFIATLKQDGPYGRSQALTTSRDFETWSHPELVFHADELDQALGAERIRARFADPDLQQPVANRPASYNVDVYNLAVFRYESLYLGLAALFHATGPSLDGANSDGFHLIEVLCSRDLRTWQRVGNREVFIGPSKVGSGAYDLTQLLPPSAPISHGDELWFYYTGIKYRESPPHPDPDKGAVCLAVLRRDGFVSLDAGESAGSLITRPLRLPGKRLFVNLDAPQGELRAALSDASGKLIGGFGMETCVPLTGNHLRAELRWQGSADLWPLMAQEVRIRFQLRRGSLYSYWFEEEAVPPPFGVVRDDFEGVPVGSRPRLAEVYVEGKGDSLAVTAEFAATGTQSLKVVDAPGLEAEFNPHFYYAPGAEEGRARCSFDIRLEEGSSLYHAWRDSGGTGPLLIFKDRLLQVEGIDSLALPVGTWIHVEVRASLGKSASGTWDLAVTLPGEKEHVFGSLQPKDKEWGKTVSWLGFASQATDREVYYLDNLEFTPVAAEGAAAVVAAAAGADAGRERILVINGVDYATYRVGEALADRGPDRVVTRGISIETDGVHPQVTAALDQAISAAELRRTKVLILVNAPAPALGPGVLGCLRENVEDGLNILILGGLFSLGKGQYEGTVLAEIAPVVTADRWSVRRLAPPPALLPAAGVSFPTAIGWDEQPVVPYLHDDRLREGADVWLQAGGHPVLAVRRLGKGAVAAFLGAPIGTAPAGTLPYWQWQHWPRLLGEIVTRLAAAP